MNILFVCRGENDVISPFIFEQAQSLRKQNINIDFFLIKGKSFFRYFKSISKINEAISIKKYDLIHAHYGLSGLSCIFQFKVPLVVTFHGSDINNFNLRIISALVASKAAHRIFVSDQLHKKLKFQKSTIIPCGIDLSLFRKVDKFEARQKLKLKQDKTYILFAQGFDNPSKNFQLAQNALEIINNSEIEIIELWGYEREEVVLLFNAVDVALLTSKKEGSPVFIKEALVCGCPIVSTDVGDIKRNIEGIEGCYLTSFEPNDVADKIIQAISFSKTSQRTKGLENIKRLKLDSVSSAKLIEGVYKEVLYK
jgi:teichuronic acid biosynthesis glycosyltransferase TuaC